MKISMLSKSDESGGGASRVAANLSYLLEKTNEIAVTKFANTENINYIDIRGKALKKKLYLASQLISRTIGYPDIFTTEILNLKKADIKKTDIFHIHDISSAISPLTLKKLSRIAPVVWTLHDCSPFTGGCIYPLSCTNYNNKNCSNCPQLKEWPLSTKIDHTQYMQSLKIEMINKHLTKIICPSQWIAKLAVAAGVSENLISVIYNSVDINLFYPRKNNDTTKLCILLTSVDINNRFKGIDFALKIINKLKIGAEIFIIGKNSAQLKKQIAPHHSVRVIDQTFDKQVLASYYRKADLLLHTSIADNCPLTVLEALSSGVPVITFNTGGIPELIRHNIDGWISDVGDIESSVNIIEHLQKNPQVLNKWKKNCRQTASENFNNIIFLKKHLNLYRELIDAKKS